MNKRGISALIATVLIILITTTAVSIIWAAVIPIIKDQIKLDAECLKATQTLSLRNACKSFSYVGADNNNPFDYAGFKVQIKRGHFDVAIEDLQFGFTTNEGVRDAFLASDWPAILPQKSDIPGINGMRHYDIDFTEITGGTMVCGHPFISTAFFNKEISVAPVVRYENKEKICSPVTIKTHEACTGSDTRPCIP